VEKFERDEAKRFEELILQCDKRLALGARGRRKGERLVTLGYGGYKFVEQVGRERPSRSLRSRKRRRPR
jgi:hypothetical protein